MSLRDAWDAAAADWIRWARSEDLDHYFWRLNLPSLLELLPPPGRLTVDVGCGEGRVARELLRLGHRVVGVEGSPALAAAAREAEPSFEVHVADAAAMPLADGCADLAVASMSLLNLDDLPAAVGEVARVLGPGGRFVFNVPHPSSDEVADYFETTSFAETRDRGGVRMTFHDTHRPLSAYLGALEAAGLLVEALREPRPGAAHVAAHPSAQRWTREPGFLLVRSLKPPTA